MYLTSDTFQAEDDVGISDPAGIATFASYFHEALSRPLFVDGSDAFYPGNIEANQLALRLDYRIGSMPIESNLLLEAVQRNADIGFYSMMRVLFLNDPSKTSVSWSSSKSMVADTGLTSAASFSNVYSSIEPENNVNSSIPAEPEPVESDEVITAAVKAKKRKATGVNLLLNKKVISLILCQFGRRCGIFL